MQQKQKKSKTGCVVGCVGCLGVFLALAGVGGYLWWLDSSAFDRTGDELASAPIVAGQPFNLAFGTTFGNYGSARIYLDVTGQKGSDGQLSVLGAVHCTPGGLAEPQLQVTGLVAGDGSSNRIDYSESGDQVSTKMLLWQDYARGARSYTCTGEVHARSGTFANARVVATQLSRPSDWIAAAVSADRGATLAAR